MKILHIISNLGSGGAEKLIEETVPRMNEKEGIKVDVLLLTDNNNVFDKSLTDNGVKVDVIPLRKPRNPINIYYIKKHIVEGEYDIVHAHLFPTIYWTSIASKFIFKNKPQFVMTEHSTHNRRRERDCLRYLEKIIYFNYDKIISISQQTQSNLVSWLKPKQGDLDRFIVIENGVDIDKFKNAVPYKKSEICSKFTENTKLLCMVGRFSKAKDQPTLIKAMLDLPENVHLLLVGEGPLKGENQNLAKQLGVDNRAHFLGYRNDVEKILKTVDIVVLSSNWEGFGLAIVEAMAAGLPVIASNIPGLSEAVDGAGILFPKGDYIKLAEIIKALVSSSKKRTEISRLCKIKSEEFNINTMIKKYIYLYYDLLNK